MSQSAAPARHQGSLSDIEIANRPANSHTDCAEKIQLALRTLGLNHAREQVEQAEDEIVIERSLSTALAYLVRL